MTNNERNYHIKDDYCVTLMQYSTHTDTIQCYIYCIMYMANMVIGVIHTVLNTVLYHIKTDTTHSGIVYCHYSNSV